MQVAASNGHRAGSRDAVQKLVCDGFVRASDSHAGAETTCKDDGRRKTMQTGGGGHAAMGATPGGAGRCV
jgi:hypothetical protein